MESNLFEKFLAGYKNSDVDGKVELYVATEGLTKEQYHDLLVNFPLDKLNLLEAALG